MSRIEFDECGRPIIPPEPEIDVEKIRTSIKPDRMSFSEIIHELDKGTLVIPAFQRDLVWSKAESIALLDSIYRGYPIGSFLIWEAKKEMSYAKSIGNYKLNEPHDENTLLCYILDGQQRIASIYACLREIEIKGEEYSVFFDLDEQKFVGEKTEDSGRYVRFSEALGKDHLEIMRSLTLERQEIFERLYNAFMTYDFSIIRIKGQPIDVVCEIFERVNNTGRKLTVVDLLVAKTWDKDFDLRKGLKEYTKKLRVKHFDKIDERNILQCISVHNFKRCHKREILKLNKSLLKNCWTKSLNAISMSIDFIKNNLNIEDSKILPFFLLVVPISYFFYYNNSPNKRQIEEIFRWFWKACLSNRYDSGSDTKIAEDIIQFDLILEDETPKFDYQYSFDIEKIKNQPFSTGNAFCKTILSLLAYMRPRNFKNNLEVDLNSSFSKYNSKEFHHFFPKNYLETKGFEAEEIEKVVNICFQPMIPHREIGDKGPEEYLNKFKADNPEIEDTLKSHLIKWSFLSREIDFNKFLEIRAKEIDSKLRGFAGIEKVIRIENEKIVSEIIEIESLLRRLVNKKLEETDRKWYKNESYINKLVYKKIFNSLQKEKEKNEIICEGDIWNYIDLGVVISILESNEDKFRYIFKKSFVDYNLVLSIIRLMNNARSKELHGRQISSITETDIETLKLQLPLLKKSILEALSP